jgi:hypothetical protein
MNVQQFVDELLQELVVVDRFAQIAVQTEGPTARVSAYVSGRSDCFLRSYFNETTGTIAFALIEQQQRIWGIDCDNRRGWHKHPLHDPTQHSKSDPLSIREIIAELRDILQ